MNEKGIFIEWSFWRDKTTTLSEKAILLEIQNLTMLELGCIASNKHFAELMGIKKEAVSRLISSLVDKGYITSKIKEGSRNFSRQITINKLLRGGKQNVISPLTNCLETKGNKSINKTIYIVEYLNEKANKQFKPSTASTKRLVNARLKEGFTQEDFETVINLKVSEWEDDSKMKKYLCPETLFGTKFEKYLQQEDQEPDWSRYAS